MEGSTGSDGEPQAPTKCFEGEAGGRRDVLPEFDIVLAPQEAPKAKWEGVSIATR